MWWLWLVVAGLIALVVWDKREGYTEDDPYTLSMKHQGEIVLARDIFAKYLDPKNEKDKLTTKVENLKEKADQNDKDFSILQNNMAMTDMNKRKNAYPDPADVDLKAS